MGNAAARWRLLVPRLSEDRLGTRVPYPPIRNRRSDRGRRLCSAAIEQWPSLGGSGLGGQVRAPTTRTRGVTTSAIASGSADRSRYRPARARCGRQAREPGQGMMSLASSPCPICATTRPSVVQLAVAVAALAVPQSPRPAIFCNRDPEGSGNQGVLHARELSQDQGLARVADQLLEGYLAPSERTSATLFKQSQLTYSRRRP